MPSDLSMFYWDGDKVRRADHDRRYSRIDWRDHSINRNSDGDPVDETFR